MSYKQYNRAKKLLLGLKTKLFDELRLTSSPRVEAVFDLTISGVVWSVIDCNRTAEGVYPYLKRMMQTHMSQGAAIHLSEEYKNMSECERERVLIDIISSTQRRMYDNQDDE